MYARSLCGRRTYKETVRDQVYLASAQPKKWRFWSIFNFRVIARDALILSFPYVFEHGDHSFEIQKSRKKSEMAKSDEKISILLLEFTRMRAHI